MKGLNKSVSSKKIICCCVGVMTCGIGNNFAEVLLVKPTYPACISGLTS